MYDMPSRGGPIQTMVSSRRIQRWVDVSDTHDATDIGIDATLVLERVAPGRQRMGFLSAQICAIQAAVSLLYSPGVGIMWLFVGGASLTPTTTTQDFYTTLKSPCPHLK